MLSWTYPVREKPNPAAFSPVALVTPTVPEKVQLPESQVA